MKLAGKQAPVRPVRKPSASTQRWSPERDSPRVCAGAVDKNSHRSGRSGRAAVVRRPCVNEKLPRRVVQLRVKDCWLIRQLGIALKEFHLWRSPRRCQKLPRHPNVRADGKNWRCHSDSYGRRSRIVRSGALSAAACNVTLASGRVAIVKSI